MPHLLHLLKPDHHATAVAVIERQSRAVGTRITVVLLHGAAAPALPGGVTVRRLAEAEDRGDLTCPELLDLIFSADSVVSW